MNIAVIIPCYKQEAFILDAMRSAAHCRGVRTLFVCVDGSPTWPNFARVFIEEANDLERETRVRITPSVSEVNRGLSVTRNEGFGLALAYGADWIVPLDADDRLNPTWFDDLENEKVASDVGFIYGDYAAFSETKKYAPMQQVGGATVESMLVNPWLPPCAVVRASAFKALKEKNSVGYDPEVSKLGGFEDWLFWLELMALGWQGHYKPGVMWHYRRYDAGGSMRDRAWSNVSAIRAYMSGKMRRLYNVQMPFAVPVAIPSGNFAGG